MSLRPVLGLVAGLVWHGVAGGWWISRGWWIGRAAVLAAVTGGGDGELCDRSGPTVGK